jgi:ABC-type multidrug transport system fused ATPase/permease subunit
VFQSTSFVSFIILTFDSLNRNRSQWAVTGGARCAGNVFDKMVAAVLRAPVSYFEAVPLGRVLSRFTYDTEMVDINLTEAMSTLMISVR